MAALLTPQAAIAAAVSVTATFLLLRGRRIERAPWPLLALAFTISALGVIGLALGGASPLQGALLAPAYALLVGPAFLLTIGALLAYTSARTQPRTRFSIILLIWLAISVTGRALSPWLPIAFSLAVFAGLFYYTYRGARRAAGTLPAQTASIG
ncbi:MAG: hypothetical protein HY259_01345 [Chloroflexi bacterium]|nr:hypothetical protein [Chloroflexota bacterium]